MTGRYCLVHDNSTHWYVIPVAKQHEWELFCDIPEDDERSWDAPDFARPVGGAPSLVTFTDPEIA